MDAANAKLERVERFWFFWLPLMTGVAIFLGLFLSARIALSQENAQPSDASAEQASQALYEAVKDDNEPAISRISGAWNELTSSRDQLEDKVEQK
jgi:hypothetical protein